MPTDVILVLRLDATTFLQLQVNVELGLEHPTV